MRFVHPHRYQYAGAGQDPNRETDSETGKGLPGAVFTVTGFPVFLPKTVRMTAKSSGHYLRRGRHSGNAAADLGRNTRSLKPVPDDYLDDGYSVTVRIPAECKDG